MSFQNCKVVACNVDADAYHAEASKFERGDPKYPISPSTLKEITRCPRRWLAGYVAPDSDAKEWGQLLDTAILTPELAAKFVMKPAHYPAPKTHDKVKKGLIKEGDLLDWNEGAKVCSDWTAEQIAAGNVPIAAKKYLSLADATKRFSSDEILKDFVACSDRQVLVEGEWVDTGTRLVIPVRCLIDLVPWHESEFATCLGDLKTTRSASPFAFKRFAFDMGYHVQAAFDIDLYKAATGQDRTTWCFLLQENFAPWETSRCMLSHSLEDIGRASYRESLAIYAQCLKTGRWNGYDDHDEAVQGWSLLEADPWMESKSMFAPKPQFEEHEDAQYDDEVMP